MSAVNYGQARVLPDFATRYMFDMQFTRKPAGVLVPNDFGLRVVGSGVPTRTDNEPDEMNIHGHRISQPGQEDTSGQLTLTLFETADLPILQMLATWRNLNRDTDSGVMAPRSAVTADLRLKLLNRQKQTIYNYDLRDCWVSSNDLGALDATQRNGIMSDISITLMYDHFIEGPA